MVLHSRTSTITIDVLNPYQKLITNTSSDLEKYVQEINGRLEALAKMDAGRSDEITTKQTHYVLTSSDSHRRRSQ